VKRQNAYNSSVEKFEGKRDLKTRHRCKDNIETDIKGIECECLD
jgi:hypothetical protein